MATAEIEEDIFECSVCLNYMLDRNPRSLSCLHTFCEDCLNQLMNNRKIRCPTCREITELKRNDVKELRVNFHLLKIKDREVGPQSSTKKNAQSKNKLKSMCQICDMKSPAYKCKDCPQLMCESCKDKHNQMFEGHGVFEMCEKHEDGITHLCKKCVLPLCMKCGILDHNEHRAYFIDYNKGTEELKEEVKTLHNNMGEEIKQIDAHLEETALNHGMSLDIDKNLATRQRYYEGKITEIKKYKDVIKRKCEEYERIQKACTEIREQCNVRAASLKALTDDSPGFCNRYSQIRPRAQQVLQEAKKNLQVKYSPPQFVLTYTQEPVAIDIKEIQSGKMSLVKEKLLLDIPRSDEINCKAQIAFIGDDVIMVTYNNPQHVIRLNERGGVVARYYPEMKGEVRGVSVYDNRIYIVQDKAITVISQRYGEDTVVYKPDGCYQIHKILVLDKSNIFISDWCSSDGKVYKYNTENNQTEVVVKDMKGPFYMTIISTLHGPRYIVTEYNINRISMYDQRWNLLNTIGRPGSGEGEFKDPHATAVTECGLLVADYGNRRISHYSLEGRFLGQVITRQDGLDYKPRGIAYRYPYLWVCGWGDPVKCYQVKYQ